MFKINVVKPKGMVVPYVNAGYTPVPLAPPDAEWKGMSWGITLLAECSSDDLYISKFDSKVEREGFGGENHFYHNRIEGELSYFPLAYGSELASYCEPTNAFYAYGPNGTKQVFYRLVSYPNPVSLSGTVSGPDSKISQNQYEDTVDLYGFWDSPNEFQTTWTRNHRVWRKSDNKEVQNVTYTYHYYYRYNPVTMKWMQSSKSYADTRTIDTKRFYVDPFGSFNFRTMSIPFIYLRDNRDLFDTKLFGDLALRACDAYKNNDVNMISYCKELPGLPQLAISTIKAAMNLDNPKTWADLFLSTKYGWVMSYKDTMSLLDYAESTLTQRGLQQTIARAGQISQIEAYNKMWSVEAHIKIKLGESKTSPSSQLLKLINSGFWPTAANLWDLVPYSFVVNWITGIQSVINAIDANIYAGLLPIRACVVSTRNKARVESLSLGENLYGDLTSELYVRRVRHSVPYVPLQLGDFTLNKHWLESGALIVQHVLK